MRGKTIVMVLLLFFVSFAGQAQTRREKNEFIIQKMDLVKVQKKHYDDRISFLKMAVSGSDTIRLLEIEKMLTEQYITEELNRTFDSLFSDIEINDIYIYCHSSSLEKLFYSKANRYLFYIQTPLDNELLTILNRHVVYEK